jgi:hypothetical protein
MMVKLMPGSTYDTSSLSQPVPTDIRPNIDTDKENLEKLRIQAELEKQKQIDLEKAKKQLEASYRPYTLAEFDRNKVFTREIIPEGSLKPIKYSDYIRNNVGTALVNSNNSDTYANRRLQLIFHTNRLDRQKVKKVLKTEFEEFLPTVKDSDTLKSLLQSLEDENARLTALATTKDETIDTLEGTIKNIPACPVVPALPPVTLQPGPVVPIPQYIPPPPPPPPPPVVTTPAPAPTPTVTAPAPAAPTPAPVKNLQFKDPNSFANRGDGVYKSLENDIRSNAFTLSSGLYRKTRQLSEWNSIVSRLRNKINFTYAQNFPVKTYFTRVLNDVDAAVKTSATTGIVSVNFII